MPSGHCILSFTHFICFTYRCTYWHTCSEIIIKRVTNIICSVPVVFIFKFCKYLAVQSFVSIVRRARGLASNQMKLFLAVLVLSPYTILVMFLNNSHSMELFFITAIYVSPVLSQAFNDELVCEEL